MVKLSLYDVKRAYYGIKQLAQKALLDNDINLSWYYISKCAGLAQQFNWIYSDDELEEALGDIGEKIIQEPNVEYQPIDNRVVFIDDFCTSFVLALQYLKALVFSGKEVLYITTVNIERNKFPGIVDKISSFPNLKVVIVDSADFQVKVKSIYDSILNFHPQKIILHVLANSKVLPVLYVLPNQVERYIINLADQTFWLGKNAIDFSLEFRQFGVSVSLQRRGLKKEQLLLVPFYPVVDNNPFQGLPEGYGGQGKIVVFSGGDVYKVIDKQNKYWHLVKCILDNYPQVVFWYATKITNKTGVNRIRDFIKENHFEGRIFLTSFRPDINEVMSHVDIYMGTCPASGSLMSQLAAMNAKPILQYYYPGTPDDETEQVLCYNDSFKISFDNEIGFLDEANRLINDEKYRKEQGERLKSAMITPDQFNHLVAKTISTNKTVVALKPFPINYDILEERWFSLEELGHVDTLPYIYGILGKTNCLKYAPTLYVKKQLRAILKRRG